jgi:hypothetical protein
MISVISAFLPMLGMLVLVWVLARIVAGSADAGRQARQVDGNLELAPNKRSFVAAPVFAGLLVYLGVMMFMSRLPLQIRVVGAGFWLVPAAIILAVFPATILVSDEGVKQVYWLWKAKRIAWKNVAQVAFDKKRQRLTIATTSGTRIVHSRQLPDRARLIAELEKHCESKVPAELRASTPTGA